MTSTQIKISLFQHIFLQAKIQQLRSKYFTPSKIFHSGVHTLMTIKSDFLGWFFYTFSCKSKVCDWCEKASKCLFLNLGITFLVMTKIKRQMIMSCCQKIPKDLPFPCQRVRALSWPPQGKKGLQPANKNSVTLLLEIISTLSQIAITGFFFLATNRMCENNTDILYKGECTT